MAGKKNLLTGDLVAFQPVGEVTVMPPTDGVVGQFLEQTANMFKARAMRMNGLLARINEAGQRSESLLRMGAERMEAAERQLAEDLGKQGLTADKGSSEESE
jgi:hypothetical protein